MLTPLDDDDNFPGSHLFYRLHLSVVTITNAFQASEEKVLPQRDGQSAKSSNNSERKVLKLEQDEKSPPPSPPQKYYTRSSKMDPLVFPRVVSVHHLLHRFVHTYFSIAAIFVVVACFLSISIFRIQCKTLYNGRINRRNYEAHSFCVFFFRARIRRISCYNPML